MKLSSLFACIVILFSMTACQQRPPEPKNTPVEVTASTIEPQTIPAVFEFIGFVESSHAVEIRARVEGFLEAIAYNEGWFVNEGDLLFQIDPKPYEVAVDSAKGQLKRQEAVLWNAKVTKERLQPLYEKKAASKRDLDNAIAAELSAEADVDTAKAQLAQAEINLGYTTIKSPVSGLAGKANYREGSLVGPITNSLLTTVSVVNPIWVYFNVSEGDLLKYGEEEKKGSLILPGEKKFTVQLILADGSLFPYKGQLNFTEPTLDQSTGTLSVRAQFHNPDAIIKPGQFVRAKVEGAIRPNAIVIPQRAIQQGKQGMYVYVVDKDNKAGIVYVVAGDWVGDDWIIKSGLKKGDIVIVDGVNKIQVGTPVNVTKYIAINSSPSTTEQTK